jgi:hypothetical protein
VSTAPNQNRPSGDNQRGIAPKHLIRLKIIDALDANCRLLIKYGCLAIVAYLGYRSIAVLSGQYTFADIGIKFLANVRIANSVGYVVGVGGLAYGRRQKKLREDAIEQLAPRIKELEAQIDPNRTSSGLTERGRTRPEDAT